MAAINAMLFKLVNKILSAILANDSSHGTTAFCEAESCRKMNVNFRRFYSVGSGRLNVNKCDLFYEYYYSVF